MKLQLRTSSRAAQAAAILLALEACGSNGGESRSNTPVGSLSVDPATGLSFVNDEHYGGGAGSFELEGVLWGRLVDVYDVSASGERSLVMRGAVVDPELQSDEDDFELEIHAESGSDELTVRHSRESESFAAKLREALDGAQPVMERSLDPTELPPWSSVARNAALVLQFNDVLDDEPGAVTEDCVRLFTGTPPAEEFGARVVRDATHGAIVGGRFHSTRVIVDLTVSEEEAASSGVPVQMTGLPEAVTTAQPNVALVVPTRTDVQVGQSSVLRSLGGRALSGGSASTLATSTQPLVRAFRSRGATASTGDPWNGFLSDSIPPRIVGNHPIQLAFVGPGGAPNRFVVDFQFQVPACAPFPHENDRLEFPNHTARVLIAPNAPINGFCDGVLVHLLSGNPATFAPMAGRYCDPFTGAPGQAPDCYVTFAPAAAAPPNAGVLKHAKLFVRFSEPIDPASVRPLDSLTVSYDAAASAIYKRVVADIVPDNGLKGMLFVPKQPLRHQQGLATSYLVDVLGGSDGVRDLAGNPLAAALHASFTIAPGETTMNSGSFSLRFDAADEDGDGRTEVRGGVLYDLLLGKVIPRPVTRFSALADTQSPTVAAMTQLSQPVQSPLSRYGSRTMMTWRYHDLGFALRDDSTHDIDVEGLNWSPAGGALSVDSFSQFEMAFAHSKFLPDEQINSFLLPNWPNSGVVATFANNLLDPLHDPSVVVHPRALGYTVQPSDAFVATNGAVMAPWPLNQYVPPSQFKYWTWRDTSTISLGGPLGTGADNGRLQQVTKSGLVGFYPVNKVPTIALPLLMEFRTWPDANALGLNGLRVAIAINSSARPAFRAYSTGGVHPLNPAQIKVVFPDAEPVATGTYGPLGNQTSPLDNVFAYGQADFVVRVSRMHTRWFDTFGTNTTFAEPYVEHAASLPAGTQVVVAYRGAYAISVSSPPTGVLPYTDAGLMDSYGDGYTVSQLMQLSMPTNLTFTPSFFNVPPNSIDKTWKSSISAVNGARYLQARVSFVSNPQTGLSPDLGAIGFSYRR